MNYEGLVASLLTLGEAGWKDDWQAKYQPLGFSQEHLPDLLRMITDEELVWPESSGDAMWARIHAWRLLGVLRAAEAVPQLLEQMGRDEEDDWSYEEIPKVLAMIGEPALRPLAWHLADQKRSVYARAGAAEALAQMPKHHPELRQECVSRLERELAAHYRKNNETLNGFLIAHLIDFKAVETIATIRQAYQERCVDLAICGDIEDVEIDFGLREQRSTPPPRLPLCGLFAPKKKTGAADKIGRNDPCPCGSGKKYKKCCGGK